MRVSTAEPAGHGPPLTALYVPGDRPDRFEKAVAAGPDIVIVDLEDAVAPARKDFARHAVTGWLGSGLPGVAVQVRVNGPGTRWRQADLEAVARLPPQVSLRLPKTENVQQVQEVRAVAGAHTLYLVVESARGVLALEELAALEGIAGLSLGEADLAGELGTSGEAALGWVRSRLVVAAAAAGLAPPMMSVFTDLGDTAGLERSCRLGRDLGFLGRAAVHPSQLATIERAFAPTAQEVARAEEVLLLLEGARRGDRGAVDAPAGHSGEAIEVGVSVDRDGRMVDAAMLGRARRTLRLSQRRTPT